MHNEKTGKPEDLIPEELAIRRGMVYSKDRHDKVCRAEIEAPFLIDQLYNHEIIGSDHHFYGVQFITMRKVFLSPVEFKVGMMLVKRAGGDEPASDKAIPMEDTDYMEAETRDVGRPTKYDPAICPQVEKLCKLGLIDKELAEFLDICEATLNNWKLEHPEFLESIKRGKLVADADVAEKLYQRATGFEWDEATPIKKKTVTYKDGKRLKESEEIVIVNVHRVVPPDTAAGVHWLTNRQPDRWKNKQQHEHAGKDGAPLKFTLALGDAKGS